MYLESTVFLFTKKSKYNSSNDRLETNNFFCKSFSKKIIKKEQREED